MLVISGKELQEGEVFGVLPPQEGWSEGELRCNLSMRRSPFSSGAIQNLLGWETDQDLELCSILYRGELQLIPVDAEVAVVLAVVEKGELPELSPLVWEMLEMGFLIWLPKVN